MTSPSNIKKKKKKEAESGRVCFFILQTASSEYQCRRTTLNTPDNEAPPLSILPAHSVYNSATASLLSYIPDICPFPSLPHVHTFFSQSSSYWLLIRSVPFPITAVPLSLHLQFLLPSFPSGLLHSVHPLRSKNTAVSVPDTSSCQDSIPAYFKKECLCYF